MKTTTKTKKQPKELTPAQKRIAIAKDVIAQITFKPERRHAANNNQIP